MKPKPRKLRSAALCPIRTESIRFGIAREVQQTHNFVAVLEAGDPLWQPNSQSLVPENIKQAYELCRDQNRPNGHVFQDKDICKLVEKSVTARYFPGGSRHVDNPREYVATEARSLTVFAVSFSDEFLPVISASANFEVPDLVSLGSNEFERQATHAYLDLSVQFAFRIYADDSKAAARGFAGLQELERAVIMNLNCALSLDH